MHKSEQHSPIIIPHLLIYEIDIISTQSNPGNRVTRCVGLIWCSIIRKDFITWYAQSIPIDNIEIEKLHQLLSHDLLHHFVACIRSHPPEPSPDDRWHVVHHRIDTGGQGNMLHRHQSHNRPLLWCSVGWDDFGLHGKWAILTGLVLGEYSSSYGQTSTQVVRLWV